MIKKAALLSMGVLSVCMGACWQTLPGESVQGLPAMFLYAPPLATELETAGLSTSQVQKAAGNAVRDAGIGIFSEPQAAAGSAKPAINVDTLHYSDTASLDSVHDFLWQEAPRARLSEASPFPAQTGEAAALVISGANRMDLLRQPRKARVGEFIGDFKSADEATSE